MHICLGTTPTVQQTMTFSRLQIDEVNRANQTRRTASGKPINVARVLTTLGERAAACVPLGGETGQIARADLLASGIEDQSTLSTAPTRLCVTVINQSSGEATELIEESGPLSPDETTAVLARLQKLIGSAKSLVLSGTLAMGVPSDFYARCCAIAKQANVPAIVDARGEALQLALGEKPKVAKPNLAELASTLSREIRSDRDLRDAMLQVHNRGAQWVVVTRGGDGAVASDGQVFWRISAPQVKVVSAIGSGDAFAAGLACAIAGGADLAESCRLGAACAGANAMRAVAGVIEKSDVLALKPQVTIERWPG